MASKKSLLVLALIIKEEYMVFRKEAVIFVCLIGFLSASSSAWSHGGRLNSEGCHNDKKTGTLHCHRSSAKVKVGNGAKPAAYNRDNWHFRSSASPVSSAVLGWYTGIDGSATDVDHVVALKDAYLSGGHS